MSVSFFVFGEYVMSDLITTQMVDDLWVKKQTPNHLATPLEKQAATGARPPAIFTKRIAHLQHLTKLAQHLLLSVLGEELALLCLVVCVQGRKITISLPSATAVNHVRYLQVSCLEALRQHTDFSQFFELGIILSTKKQTKSSFAQLNTKKPLSENIKRNITQSTQVVITNKKLQQSLLNLIHSINTVEKID